MAASLPYHESGIVTILVQSSFLLILNLINVIVDNTLYCGLLGQIFIGVTWGTPGAKWLGETTEEVIVQLGYLGLILLVYQVSFLTTAMCLMEPGGLSTSFASLKANLLLSIAVAITGIGLPIGGATPLQAFAAGAALCPTSLGTTFTVLSTSGLTKSRLGVVLTSAAMIDDVIGLVMVQVISNLGGSSSFEATTVIRPVFVSLAFAVLKPLVCRFFVKPCTLFLNKRRQANPNGTLQKIFSQPNAPLGIHTALLLALVSGGTYAGTSNLFTAHIAGVCISWWDTELAHQPVKKPRQSNNCEEHSASASTAQKDSTNTVDSSSIQSASFHITGIEVYERFYQQAVERILKPLFFASIDFSIPISRMFAGSVVWRGIVYTLLMLLGKLVCGLWLVRFSIPTTGVLEHLKRFGFRLPSVPHLVGKSGATGGAAAKGKQRETRENENTAPPRDAAQMAPSNAPESPFQSSTADGFPSSSLPNTTAAAVASPTSTTTRNATPNPATPLSLYPGAIIGSAMVARGEIGFLISSVAQSKGVLSDEIFLVATWAIMLCTIIGPLTVGLLVRRVKTLQRGRESKRDALGVWGVD